MGSYDGLTHFTRHEGYMAVWTEGSPRIAIYKTEARSPPAYETPIFVLSCMFAADTKDYNLGVMQGILYGIEATVTKLKEALNYV
jgi:hypothetical protein